MVTVAFTYCNAECHYGKCRYGEWREALLLGSLFTGQYYKTFTAVIHFVS
jgi:hypothetical protein